MSWTPPERPQWAVRMNAHADVAGGAAALVSLDPDELIASAQATTGLDDFGDDDWREPYEILMRSFENEAGLHLAGRAQVRTHVLVSLRARLELAALWKEHPEILDAPISSPTFIVGSPRSGTSILHELMDQDPATRAPAFWEMWFPAPAARGQNRGQECDDVVKFWHDLQPEYETMHANSGFLPNECIMILQHAFVSDWWGGNYVVPSYSKFLIETDHRAAYRYHRRILQTLQWQAVSTGAPPPRWLLKAPSHLFQLRALFAAYPDANIVRTHRDPLRTLPSSINLMGTLRWMHCREVDMSESIARLPSGTALLYQMEIAHRANGELPNERFVDIHFADIVARPAEAVQAVYERLGWPFDRSIADAITRYATEKPQGSRGVHRYSLADIGLDAKTERERFRFYMDHYGVTAEPIQESS